MDDVLEGGGGLAGEGGEEESLWWWFSLNRENGGPAYHNHTLSCPFPASHFNVIIGCLVFIFPLVLGIVLLPSVRSRSRSSLLVVLLCFGTGFLLVMVYGSSSWLVGEAEVNASIGPQKPPVQGTLGIWAGLWHVRLSYVTGNFTFNERVDWTSRRDFVTAHKKALSDGWPWPLLSLTAELGGEGTAWRGHLGDGLRLAGLAASSLLVAALTVWVVWVLLFTASPQLAAQPIMLSGTIIATCSMAYVVCVSLCIPHTLTVANTKMELRLGLSWWATVALSVSLTLVGLGLLLYNIYRPGHFATVFELDFGTPNHRLYHCSRENPKPIFAFDETEEVYSQGYVWAHLRKHSRDSDEVVERKDTKKRPSQASEREEREHAVAYRQPIQSPELGRRESGSEMMKTQNKDDVVFEEELVSTLREGQDHTTFTPPPDTLRRRTPEQPQEQQPQQKERVTPLGNESCIVDPAGAASLPVNHSTLLVKKYMPKTNALVRTPFLRSSVRRSLKEFHRFKHGFSFRLSYRSSLRKKSVSLSKLTLPSVARLYPDEDVIDQDEWVEECEEPDAAAVRDSVTRF